MSSPCVSDLGRGLQVSRCKVSSSHVDGRGIIRLRAAHDAFGSFSSALGFAHFCFYYMDSKSHSQAMALSHRGQMLSIHVETQLRKERKKKV
jgi:hypothetical protein